jgi:Ca-activated chloride channel family protein
MMEEILKEFHFLRPDWFYALIPAVLLFALLRYRQQNASNWENSIDSSLLPFLLENSAGTVSKSPFFLMLFAWLIATIALAGPVWEKTPQPVHEREDALIVVLDLTRSMYSSDVKPNRLVRARRKLIDLLNMRDEGVTGLVVFSGNAHTVSPLTDDTNTIIAMIPALRPEIMPAPGSQLSTALQRSLDLFEQTGVVSGRILVITDEIRDVAEAQAVVRNFRYSFPISVLSVGTPEGAPIPTQTSSGSQGYLKDRNGTLVIPKVNYEKLQSFANLAGGRFATMTLGDDDLTYLLADDPLLDNSAFRDLERDFDVWFEEGPWLLLLLLPLAALAFRRGWIWGFMLLIYLPVDDANASLWDDLWQTRDQQAMAALSNDEANAAAELFENPAWKGSAHYKNENFKDAGDLFASSNNADSQYNLGNSLTKDGELEKAIDAYSNALTLDPDNEDAAFNKKLVEDLLDQQQQEQQNEEGEQEEGEDEGEGEQQQSENEDGQEENEEQSSSDQEQQDQGEEQQEEQEQESKEDGEEQDAQDQQMAEEDAKLNAEEQQALQQWLRRVPDDPGGLLKRKFEQQHEDAIRNGSISRTDPNADW